MEKGNQEINEQDKAHIGPEIGRIAVDPSDIPETTENGSKGTQNGSDRYVQVRETTRYHIDPINDDFMEGL